MCLLWLDKDDDGQILDIEVFVCRMASAFQNMKVQLFIHSPKSSQQLIKQLSRVLKPTPVHQIIASKEMIHWLRNGDEGGGKLVNFVSCGCMLGFHDLTNMREVERLVGSFRL